MKNKDIIPTLFIASSVCHTFTKGTFSLIVATITGVVSLANIGYEYIHSCIDQTISIVESNE